MCARKKQLDFYENFFKKDWEDIDDAIVEIDKKKERGEWTNPDWK